MDFSRCVGATRRVGSGETFCVLADTVRVPRPAVGLRRVPPLGARGRNLNERAKRSSSRKDPRSRRETVTGNLH